MKVTGLSASIQTNCYDANEIDAGLLKSSFYAGHYLLKNGSYSKCTVYNQECGIFIDDYLHIPLKQSKQLLTAREAEIYFLSLGKKIPNLYQAVRLKQAVDAVNLSLTRIGMQEFVFPRDILHNIWYEEALKTANSRDVRRCVVISEQKDYQRPSYLFIDDNCLLFADTILYRRSQECYEPLSPILKFSWSGIDFISAVIEHTSYDFYRGKDLKLVYLGKNTDVHPLDNELIDVSNTLYQNYNGQLYKIDSFSQRISYFRSNGKKVVMTTEVEEHYIDAILEYAGYNELHYQKDTNGLFVQISCKNVDTYKRNVDAYKRSINQ